ncbi:MAG: Flp pilus assembly protein CpaB [Betaproteobacteria bacterium]|nr:Flp pilus assembly protein CpaB [Betaproteobacteria bacterium]
MAMTAGKRRLILLGLALGMAGFAAILVKSYLNRKAAELEAKYADHTERVAVVVASKNVAANTQVVLENFAVRKMPVDMVPPDAVAPGDIERALGQSLKVSLPLGRPLLWGYLSSGVVPSFSDMLEADRRALTIAVDELNSISGMVRPYDRIDLFVISKEKSLLPGKRENKVVMPLMQDVLVKATGNIVRRETAPNGKEYDRRYSTLTLNLLPDEIGKVLIAQENGELKAVLKRPEQQETNYRPTRESDLWGGADESAKASEKIDFITLYIGGKGNGTVRTELQPYPSDTLASSSGQTNPAKTEPPDEMIGGPMTKEQIDQIEQNMKQHREEDAASAPAAANAKTTAPPPSQFVSTASAGQRGQ